MVKRPETWMRISSKEIADYRVFRVREDLCRGDDDGREGTFFVIESPDWVNIIALTPQNEVVAIEQYRHGIENTILEIPGGMIDANETPEKAARRELSEETGFSASEFVLLGQSNPNPAIQNNRIFHFLAKNCVRTHDVNFDEHESIETKLIPLSKVEELIRKGDISHSLVIAAFYYLNKHHEDFTVEARARSLG